MLKYEYTYDTTLQIVVRTTQLMYPGISILDTLFNKDRAGSKILNTLELVYTGIAEEPLITIENNWWSKQTEIQDTRAELITISDLEFQISVNPDNTSTVDNPQTTLDSIIGQDTVKEYTMSRQKRIEVLIVERDSIEDGYIDNVGNVVKPNLWLKTYRGVTTSSIRPVVTGVIPKDVRKRLIAHERNRTVRTLEDTVADLAKSNALLLSMVSGIYSTLSSTAKAKIPTAEKAIIDYAVAKWVTTSTRGDRQLAVEGTALIDKLYSREVSIADIVDKHTGV